MNATVPPATRAALRTATFGMWLPWHLLPAARLTEAIDAAGIDTRVVNASFPDVVNQAIWKRFGHGPVAGAGNVEICVAQIVRYMVDVVEAQPEELAVSLVGSHALLSYGPEVPHHLRVAVDGIDVTESHSLPSMLNWPEPVQWGKVDEFSLFAASAVKNVLALVTDSTTPTHVSGPNGLPGGYPVVIDKGRIELDLPTNVTAAEAVALNTAAARWDGIERVEDDGTVVYTETARVAMAELGCEVDAVRFEDLEPRTNQLSELYERITSLEGTNA